ncbi:hypothetical protein B296_00038890 [Ensete ventricosum]|uniref:J domain-containing protein n=1 Tax=Ensete ventricosum TaxID=4639 RepID=A0A426XLY4_ENSVE|nr:hypothetical protein B296_00038890 [Ensete ventricosum]
MGKPAEVYFQVLNIAKDSSPQEIRTAYRALVKKWHPDKHPPSSRLEAEAKFKAISQAYEVSPQPLANSNRSMVGANNDGPGGGVAPRHRSQELQKPRCTGNSVREFKDENRLTKAGAVAAAAVARPAFSSFSGPVKTKPPPVERKLECTLEELCRGCKKEIKFTRNVITNKGYGLIVRKEETQTVRVKPGWKKGTKIMFEGMGDERPGCLPADAIFTISEKEHPVFKRKGNDLVMKVEVPLVNALAGWFFSFRLLTGEKTSCSFQDEIIYPGYEKVIKGQGMPLAHDKGVRGDLRIKFHIVFPTQLSDEQLSGIKELLKDTT